MTDAPRRRPSPAVYRRRRLVAVLLALAVLIWFFLEYTRFGRMMYAVGSNERAAELAGAPVKAYKIFAYVISAVFASIGGILLAARLGRGDIASGILGGLVIGSLLDGIFD